MKLIESSDSEYDKKVDIKLSAHGTFLESQIILKVLGASKPNGLNSIAKKRLSSPMLKGGEP
jgi:hypothetical protein